MQKDVCMRGGGGIVSYSTSLFLLQHGGAACGVRGHVPWFRRAQWAQWVGKHVGCGRELLVEDLLAGQMENCLLDQQSFCGESESVPGLLESHARNKV